jgi:DNA-binding response OmpR family regulator
MRLLLAEDYVPVGQAVRESLRRTGMTVDWVLNGTEFNAALLTQSYDLIVLDLGLPDTSGEALLQRVRANFQTLPVIVTTARGSVHDRISLLDLGADDYLVKPFDLDELTARVRSVSRRHASQGNEESCVEHGPLRLVPQRRAATLNGEPIALTNKEFWVLETLMRKKNQVVTRAQLEETLYGWGEEVDSNAVEVYVHFLRRKLGTRLIHTVRGVGYQLAPTREHA